MESIASNGAGVLRREGKTIFMDMTAPGDHVTGRIIEDRQHWARAECVDISAESPLRTTPSCPLYGSCGGCTLQHIRYEAQLDIKKTLLQEAFRRIGGVDNMPEPEIVPSPPFEYRNRMQFHRISQSERISRRRGGPQSRSPGKSGIPGPRKGQAGIGLKERQSDRIIPLHDCPVADPGIRRALEEGSLSPPPEKNRFTVYSKDSLFLAEGGQEKGRVRILGRELITDVSVFFQSNAAVLERLIGDLLEAAESADASLPVADVFSGVGTFSVFLQDRFRRIDLVEENKEALDTARKNTAGPGIRFFPQKDSQWIEFLNRTGKSEKNYGFMVLDPPRQGISPLLAHWLGERGPDILVYVSCDPASLARDSAVLLKNDYAMKKLFLYDFYPQTAHIESMAVFVRTGKSHA
ncbi:class I SAM-dependent RNA methyltransferase [Treponema sp. OttesenSCG-928-L16]|nr:class I SAM-dependent RNA methyltransferase [Treponema sp. OttesenSCG-928-L16]